MNFQYFLVFASAILLRKVCCTCDLGCALNILGINFKNIPRKSYGHIVATKNITIASKTYYFFPQPLLFEEAYIQCQYLGLDFGVIKQKNIALAIRNFIVQIHPRGKPK